MSDDPTPLPAAAPRRGRPRKPRPEAPATEPAARASLTPDTWIDAAIDVLEYEGVDAVRVDVLARNLGVTRGSFYWHFKDREDLLRHMLKAWSTATTENLTRRLVNASDDPREQLRDVLSLPFRGRSAERGSRIELSIRAWARRDALAREAVDESDRSRLAYIAQIYSGLGCGLIEARHRALMTYSINVACSLLTPAGTAARQEHWLDFVDRLMRGQLADEPAVPAPDKAG